MSIVRINSQEVSFEVEGSQTYTTSLDIANVFEKRHDNILAQIEALPNDDFRRLNFKASSQVRKNGAFNKETKHYNLTRDGFALLAMGFNGAKAYQWKVAFINAFNQLEKALRENLAPSPSEITLLQSKLAETITALSEVARERDEFRDKYLKERELERS